MRNPHAIAPNPVQEGQRPNAKMASLHRDPVAWWEQKVRVAEYDADRFPSDEAREHLEHMRRCRARARGENPTLDQTNDMHRFRTTVRAHPVPRLKFKTPQQRAESYMIRHRIEVRLREACDAFDRCGDLVSTTEYWDLLIAKTLAHKEAMACAEQIEHFERERIRRRALWADLEPSESDLAPQRLIIIRKPCHD